MVNFELVTRTVQHCGRYLQAKRWDFEAIKFPPEQFCGRVCMTATRTGADDSVPLFNHAKHSFDRVQFLCFAACVTIETVRNLHILRTLCWWKKTINKRSTNLNRDWQKVNGAFVPKVLFINTIKSICWAFSRQHIRQKLVTHVRSRFFWSQQQKTTLFCQVEMATLTRQDNRTTITILSAAVVDKLCAEYEEEKAKLEAEKKEKEKLASSSKSKWSSHRLTNGRVIAARNDVNHELVRRAVAQVVEKMRDKRCCCLWRHKQADCNSARVTLGSWTWISVSRSELVKNPMIGSGLIKEYVLGFVTHVSVAACALFIVFNMVF